MKRLGTLPAAKKKNIKYPENNRCHLAPMTLRGCEKVIEAIKVPTPTPKIQPCHFN